MFVSILHHPAVLLSDPHKNLNLECLLRLAHHRQQLPQMVDTVVARAAFSNSIFSFLSARGYVAHPPNCVACAHRSTILIVTYMCTHTYVLKYMCVCIYVHVYVHVCT